MSRKRRAVVGSVAALAVIGAGGAGAVALGRGVSSFTGAGGPAIASAAPTSDSPGPGSAAPPGSGAVSDSSTVAPSSATVSDPGVQPVATDKPVVITDGKVPVIVTHWGWKADDSTAVVGGYVAGVVESDGTCTVTLTQGARKVTAESPARPDASTTACGALSVPGHELAPGHWRAVLSYSSPSSSGTASAVDIEVPS